MKIEEQTNEITEEASDPLGPPDSPEEESAEDWSPEELSVEDRAQYDKAVQAVDDFLANHPLYKQTDENRQAILEYLAEHDVAISPASLELCWEQLQDLDLEPEQREDDQPDASAKLATAGLARRTNGVESQDSDQSQEPAPPQKKSTAWRNGREIEVGA